MSEKQKCAVQRPARVSSVSCLHLVSREAKKKLKTVVSKRGIGGGGGRTGVKRLLLKTYIKTKKRAPCFQKNV